MVIGRGEEKQVARACHGIDSRILAVGSLACLFIISSRVVPKQADNAP